MKIATEYAIQHLVQKSLPRFSPADVVFHVQIDMSFSIYAEKEEDEINHRAVINLLFNRPNNATKVFWHVQMDEKYKMLREIPIDGWKLESDHDSCWTTDGLSSPLHQVYFKLRDMFPQDRIKEISEFVSFGLVSEKHYKAKITNVSEHNCYGPRAYTIELGDEAKVYFCDEESLDMMKSLLGLVQLKYGNLDPEVWKLQKQVERKIEVMESMQKYDSH